jgi:hypothetical protein
MESHLGSRALAFTLAVPLALRLTLQGRASLSPGKEPQAF